MEAIDTAIHSTYQLLDVMWPQGSGCLEGVPRALVALLHSLHSGNNEHQLRMVFGGFVG